mgnify:CR=1 FL=1
MKDLQQLSLIKSHIIKNKINTNVVSCPTIRERNGVALSSRNIKLTKKQLNIASKIFKLLKHEKKQIKISILNKKKNKILNKIKQLGASKIDYLECVNFKTLNFNYLIAGIIGFLSPNPVLFIINRNWTFKSKTGYNKMYLMFIISGICLCLHIVAQYFAHELLHVPKIFSQLFGQASAAVLNFLFLKFYLFKK